MDEIKVPSKCYGVGYDFDRFVSYGFNRCSAVILRSADEPIAGFLHYGLDETVGDARFREMYSCLSEEIDENDSLELVVVSKTPSAIVARLDKFPVSGVERIDLPETGVFTVRYDIRTRKAPYEHWQGESF